MSQRLMNMRFMRRAGANEGGDRSPKSGDNGRLTAPSSAQSPGGARQSAVRSSVATVVSSSPITPNRPSVAATSHPEDEKWQFSIAPRQPKTDGNKSTKSPFSSVVMVGYSDLAADGDDNDDDPNTDEDDGSNHNNVVDTTGGLPTTGRRSYGAVEPKGKKRAAGQDIDDRDPSDSDDGDEQSGSEIEISDESHGFYPPRPASRDNQSGGPSRKRSRQTEPGKAQKDGDTDLKLDKMPLSVGFGRDQSRMVRNEGPDFRALRGAKSLSGAGSLAKTLAKRASDQPAGQTDCFRCGQTGHVARHCSASSTSKGGAKGKGSKRRK